MTLRLARAFARSGRGRRTVALAIGLTFGAAAAAQAPPPGGVAFLLRPLDGRSVPREGRPDILDTPVLPGSLMKAVTLVAAVEAQVINDDTARVCRRTVTVDGRRYVCAHPDLKRALTPAEALAHSCNDYFVSLAPRLTRAAVNDVRTRVGFPALGAADDFAAALVGLDGPRVTPRAMLDATARLAGFDPAHRVRVSDAARRVLLEGLRGAARYGTAAALHERSISALAKTGTAPMPGGAWMGLLVAFAPADAPTRALVVVAPGGAGVDAAAVAADLLSPQTMRTDAPGGQIRVALTDAAGRIRVAPLALEDYVARVLAGEGQPRAADAAQQALAITARTFALANLNRHRRDGYDMCDTTHCQVLRPATAITREAANATAGRILVHQGRPAEVFYSAWCGGHTEKPSQVWPGAIDHVFEPSQRDEACRDEPEWTSEVRVEEVEQALRALGLRGDRLRNLRAIAHNSSGRVTRLRAEGFTPQEVSAHDLRMALGRLSGWQLMKSTAFEVRRTSAGYQFTGKGYGHGVGLCVIGAGHRAARGSSVDQILRFYFPGLRIERYRGAASETATTTITPAAPDPPTDGAKDDVQIALPLMEEGDRATVVQLVRRARDEIARRASVKAPPAIRITVHPTVESFGRATGQPWWVSGATKGNAIELLPITILRQQGQLERTVRHEVAHVLLDAALAGRPMWIREGAAFYFAAPADAGEAVVRGDCPTDAEFLRPASAGAHRSAYARAEACFRRAIASGRNWSDVR